MNIENYIMEKLYYVVFPKSPTKADKEFELQLSKLKSHKILEAEIKEITLKFLLPINNKIKLSNSIRIPQEKIINYQEAYNMIIEGKKIINNNLRLNIEYDELKIFAYAFLHANPEYAISELNYIEYFCCNNNCVMFQKLNKTICLLKELTLI